MRDQEQFIQKIQQDFNETYQHGPKLALKLKKDFGTGFLLDYAGGEITLHAEKAADAIFGLSLLKPAVRAGHIAEYLGRHYPRHRLRTLWIKDFETLLRHHNPEQACQKILLLGYNMIVVEMPLTGLESSLSSFREAAKTMSSYGLKIAVNISSNEISQENFPNILPLLISAGIDSLFWEAAFYKEKPSKYRDLLELDQAKMEAQSIEKVLNPHVSLIYSIPTESPLQAERQSHWIPALCDALSPQTCVAFSCHAGNPYSVYLPPHPLWLHMRNSNHKRHFNLLPILNIGQIKLGEGLWPILNIEPINRYLLRCNPSTCAGFIAISKHLPDEKALLSCNLWVAAQTMLGSGTPELLSETWLKAYRPEFLSLPNHIFEEIREIASNTAFLVYETNEEYSKEKSKIMVESLLSRLKLLQLLEISSLKDYADIFLRDIQRFIEHYAQRHQLVFNHVSTSYDKEESFWTSYSGTQVILLDKAQKGAANSIMAKIYEETTGR